MFIRFGPLTQRRESMGGNYGWLFSHEKQQIIEWFNHHVAFNGHYILSNGH